MIDFCNISKADLWKLGISIKNQKKFKVFTDFLLEELEVRIGRKVSEGLSEAQLEEFDSLQSQNKTNEWLERNKPNYREIVNEEKYRIIWNILKNRKKVSDSNTPDPALLSRHIALLYLSDHSYKCLCDAGLIMLKDVINYNNLLNIMDEKHKKEVVSKLVDYLI